MFAKNRISGIVKRMVERSGAMTKYRKKPVVIDAIQFLGNIDTIKEFIPDRYAYEVIMHDEFCNPEQIAIHTLEGNMIAGVTDWIIRGIKGEYYPCKDDIFQATYERVEDEAVRSVKA